ncbi:DUF4143 domain-containing protein [Actinophytocola sediminis]
MFLIKSIPAWSSGQTRRAVGTPKLAFVDTGIACHLIGQDPARLGEPGGAAGPMMENFVVMELARQLTWSTERARLYHYRTKDKQEVDAVIETPDGRVIGGRGQGGRDGRHRRPGRSAQSDQAPRRSVRRRAMCSTPASKRFRSARNSGPCRWTRCGGWLRNQVSAGRALAGHGCRVVRWCWIPRSRRGCGQ